MNKKVSFSIWYVFLAIWAFLLIQSFFAAINKVEEIPYSEFKALVAAGKVAEVSITSQTVRGMLKPDRDAKDAKPFQTVRVEDPNLTSELTEQKVKITGVIETTFWRDVLSWVLPIVVFIAIWAFIFRRIGQAQGGFMQVGQSKAKIYMEKDIKVTFADDLIRADKKLFI